MPTLAVCTDLHIRSGVDHKPDAPGARHPTKDRGYYAAPETFRRFCRQVRETDPDAAVVLGDICDLPPDWPLVLQEWRQIKTRKHLLIGNHDREGSSAADIAALLGPLETSFTLEHVRVVMLDTTYDADARPGPHARGMQLHPDTLCWLEDLLNTSPETVFILAAHCGPHLYTCSDYYDHKQALSLRALVESVTVERSIQVLWLFGHHHREQPSIWDCLGTANPGLLVPAMISETHGRYLRLDIDGHAIRWETILLPYSHKTLPQAAGE